MGIVRKRVAAVAVLSVLAATACASGPSDDGTVETFFDGKTIEIIAPVGPGGTVDGMARLFATKLEEYLPGNPTVQVTNVEGGGGILAGNQYANAYQPDGTSLMLVTQVSVLPAVLGQDGVQYDLADMTALWAANRGQAVVMVAPETGISSVEDIQGSSEELILGVIGAAGADLPGIISLEVLGLLGDDARVIAGYESGDAIRNAFLSGELNLNIERSPGYIAEFQGEVDALYTYGQIDSEGNLVRDDVVSDVPHLGEAYEILHGSEPSGEAWDSYLMLLNVLGRGGFSLQIHADAPDVAKEALAIAIEQVLQDEDYQEQLEAFMGPAPNEIIGEEAQQWSDGLANIDQDLLAWIQGFLRDEFDLEFD